MTGKTRLAKPVFPVEVCDFDQSDFCGWEDLGRKKFIAVPLNTEFPTGNHFAMLQLDESGEIELDDQLFCAKVRL